MNFLLYMIGRGSHLAGPRMTGRDALIASAAAYAAAGQFERALSAQDELVRNGNSMDLLIRGHLHLVLRNPAMARASFVDGIEGLLKYPADGDLDAGTCVDRLLDDAGAFFRQNRFTRAAETVRKARSIVEVLLAAHGGLLLTGERHASEMIASLMQVSDLTLRMMARIHLARDLSTALQSRQLREDVAPWATSMPSVERLLDAERMRLGAAVRSVMDNSEIQFRLGLVSRVAGAQHGAIAAFQNVLLFHPFHVPSAVRLALSEKAGMAALDRAYRVPAETLRLFAELAHRVQEGRTFDAVANQFCRRAGEPSRANLAFALSEMALLDESRQAWRESAVPAAA